MGVKLINLSEGDRVVDVARIVPGEEEGDQQELIATDTVEGATTPPHPSVPVKEIDEDEDVDYPDEFETEEDEEPGEDEEL